MIPKSTRKIEHIRKVAPGWKLNLGKHIYKGYGRGKSSGKKRENRKDKRRIWAACLLGSWAHIITESYITDRASKTCEILPVATCILFSSPFRGVEHIFQPPCGQTWKSDSLQPTSFEPQWQASAQGTGRVDRCPFPLFLCLVSRWGNVHHHVSSCDSLKQSTFLPHVK